MAKNIKLEVVTPEKIVVDEEVQIVVAPGVLGEFGVLSGHTPFLTTIKVGVIRYMDEKGVERNVFVSGGFAEALPDKVTVIAESAERRSDIDEDRAKSALERAKKWLEEKQKDEKVDFIRAKAAMNRAMYRVKLVGSRR